MNKRETVKQYVATTDGWLLGAQRKKGEPVGELTDREAKYLVMAGSIAAQDAKPSFERKKAEKPTPKTPSES